MMGKYQQELDYMEIIRTQGLHIEKQATDIFNLESQLTAEREARQKAEAERDEAKRQAVPEWQPIETAPKDGTKIIGWNAEFGARQTKMNFYGLGSIGYTKWERGEGPKESGWDWTEPKNNWGFSWNPTHWMPLPAAPQPEKGLSDDSYRTSDSLANVWCSYCISDSSNHC